jgi:hypothetical protein
MTFHLEDVPDVSRVPIVPNVGIDSNELNGWND